MSDAPGYWRDETSGLLRPAIEAYLNDAPLTTLQCAAMRAYLRQWIDAPCWRGPAVDELRRTVGALTTKRAIDVWLDRAMDAGIDPL